MRNLMELGLLGLLLTTTERPNRDQNPALMKMIDNLGYGSYWDASPEELKEVAFNIIETVDTHFEYFYTADMSVNKLVNAFLVKLYDDLQNGYKEDLRTVAIQVCALGNRDARDYKCYGFGVEAWISFANAQIKDLRERFDTLEQVDYLPLILSRLDYANRVLEIIDVFVTTYRGMRGGVEEYAPADYQDVYPLEDWVDGTECGGDEGCGCGCKLDKPIMLLEGMEDFLAGRVTPASKVVARQYFLADLTLRSVAGNEEGAWDAIKEMGSKAYEWCKEVLDSFLELFSGDKAEEEATEAETAADTNKKALQAIADKTLKIKPAAKDGIVALAKTTDPTGAISKVVGNLNSLADASRVIDGLQSLLNKELKKGGKLDTKLENAKKAVNDLQTANRKVTGNTSDNKEVATNAKAGLEEKIKAAKAALTEVRAASKAQKKLTSGIQRMIKGITPKIFMDENQKTPGTGTPPPAEPAEKPAAKGKGKK